MKKKKPLASEKGEASKSGAMLFAGKIYEKLPVLPILDRPTSAIAYFCILLYFGFVAMTFITNPSSEISAELAEGQLYKNTNLQLAAGERYVYELSLQGDQPQTRTVGYEVKSVPSCAGLLVVESAPSSPSKVCISKSGNAISDELPQTNSTFGNQSIILFSPWMLAASENFSWSVDTVFSAMGIETHFPTSYKSNGIREMAGRKSFEIFVHPQDSAQTAKYYIDSEKRVLLFADFGNLTARMVAAPFELNWSNKN